MESGGNGSKIRRMDKTLDDAAAAIDGLLVMMSQRGGDIDYHALDRAFEVLASAREQNPALPLSIPIAYEIARRQAGEPPSKTWQELHKRALQEFERVRAEARAK